MMSPTDNSTTPPENMSVSELRAWLKNFGNKNKDHFDQGQIQRRRSPTKPKPHSIGRVSVRGRIHGFGLQPATQDDDNNSQQENLRPDPAIGSNKSPVGPSEDVVSFGTSPVQTVQPIDHGKVAETGDTEEQDLASPAVGSFSAERSSDDLPIYRQDMEKQFLVATNATESLGFTEPTNEGRAADSTVVIESVESPNDDVLFSFEEPSKSFDLPEAEAPVIENELCLSLSAVTMASASFSLEADACGSIGISKLESVEEEDETFEMENEQNNPFFPQDAKEPTQNVPEPKAVPAEWSDLEPIDFDASSEASSGSDDDGNTEEGEDYPFASPSYTWPQWNQRGGDAREYLKKQALPPFQGYWSDTECEEDDEDDFGGIQSVSGPRKGRSGNSARARRSRERRSRGLFTLETTFEDSPLTLSHAARESMSVGNPRPPSLSECFLVKTTGKSSKQRQPPAPSSNSMHNANLFGNKMMTAGALDLICHDRAKPLSYSDTAEPRRGLQDFFSRDQMSCSSEDSGKPSVAPDAVDAKLSKVFSNDTEVTAALTINNSPEKRQPNPANSFQVNDQRQDAPSPVPAVPVGQYGFPLLPSDFTPSPTEKKSKQKASSPVGRYGFPSLPLEAPTPEKKDKKGAQEKTKVSQSSAFSSVIEKFGGGGGRKERKTRVERRKEALEEQWATTRAVKHVKKTKWQVSRSGIYKKRVVLDSQDAKQKKENSANSKRFELA
ncbi:expressed unknown protein [Seminavis robusta]|uniref:Uncharacterized protein n=1 Tax=Seminavis robusta TaxID=568900 RepID=A0A9N8DKA8_9STRA|nr:expressed unknown protein [Seminavis robusta]|eukprot:Sro189_g081370.1 n/a (725) ;mRNA; r:1492-3666